MPTSVTVNAHAANAISGDDRLPPGEGRVQITTTALPDGMLNQYYAQSLGCSGGSPCAWQVQDGSLPAGVTFDTVAGAVLGMPTLVQTGSVTVSAYDPAWPANIATATLQLTIDPPPFVVSVPSAPAGQVGVAYQLAASVTGTMGSAVVVGRVGRAARRRDARSADRRHLRHAVDVGNHARRSCRRRTRGGSIASTPSQ